MKTVTRPTLAAALKAHSRGTEIGEGSSRKVFRYGKNFWAYKFIYRGSSNTDANVDEFENYQRVKDCMPFGIKLPEMVMLESGVLATEYIDGYQSDTDCWGGVHDCDDEPNCWYTRIHKSGLERVEGFRDISWANVIMTDAGDLYIIDLEF
jgi:hypothetical protein